MWFLMQSVSEINFILFIFVQLLFVLLNISSSSAFISQLRKCETVKGIPGYHNTCQKKFIMGGRSSVIVDMNSMAAKFVQSSVQENCVVIFSKSYCPYSNTAKQIFKTHGVKYLSVELDERSDGEEMQNILQSMTGARTVPRVFINGNSIGGAREMKQLENDGKLLNLIKECNQS